ncbi:MAG TPA: hypothetical protein VEL07_13825 [Planctomycetota bacterium]|nr:hypothetical protein [Planctomycetota bacterium]
MNNPTEPADESPDLRPLHTEILKHSLGRSAENYGEFRKTLFTLQSLVIGLSPAILGLKWLDGREFSFGPLFIAWFFALVGLILLLITFHHVGNGFVAQCQAMMALCVRGPIEGRERAVAENIEANRCHIIGQRLVIASAILFLASLVSLMVFFALALGGNRDVGQTASNQKADHEEVLQGSFRDGFEEGYSSGFRDAVQRDHQEARPLRIPDQTRLPDGEVDSSPGQGIGPQVGRGQEGAGDQGVPQPPQP